MNEPVQSNAKSKRHRLGAILTAVFAVAMLMGPGPGVELPWVNSALPVFGFPRIYVWGLFWYVVEVVVVILAYVYVWRDDDDEKK